MKKKFIINSRFQFFVSNNYGTSNIYAYSFIVRGTSTAGVLHACTDPNYDTSSCTLYIKILYFFIFLTHTNINEICCCFYDLFKLKLSLCNLDFFIIFSNYAKFEAY